MEILFWNKGLFILEYHLYGQSHRIVTEYQFCPEYLFWLIIFFQGESPVTNTYGLSMLDAEGTSRVGTHLE